jgi:hypothetical protein
MTHYVRLEVSQRLTSICVVSDTGRRLWRGQCNQTRSRSHGCCGDMLETTLASGLKPVL